MDTFDPNNGTLGYVGQLALDLEVTRIAMDACAIPSWIRCNERIRAEDLLNTATVRLTRALAALASADVAASWQRAAEKAALASLDAGPALRLSMAARAAGPFDIRDLYEVTDYIAMAQTAIAVANNAAPFAIADWQIEANKLAATNAKRVAKAEKARRERCLRLGDRRVEDNGSMSSYAWRAWYACTTARTPSIAINGSNWLQLVALAESEFLGADREPDADHSDYEGPKWSTGANDGELYWFKGAS